MPRGISTSRKFFTVTGPYALYSNPLYWGSAFLAVGAAIAARSWISAWILLVYFALIFS